MANPSFAGAAETLTEDEALSLGMSTIVHGGVADPDNEFIDAMLNNPDQAPQQDRDGRPIISYKQYLAMGKTNQRLDNYALRMFRPGSRGVWPIQATKFIKWYGLGYRPLGEKEATASPAPKRPVVMDESGPTIFFCKDKYPECGRFFDTPKGLQWHWKKDHETVKRATKPEPESEE